MRGGAQRGRTRGKTRRGQPRGQGEARERRGHTKVSPAQAGMAAGMQCAVRARRMAAWRTGARGAAPEHARAQPVHSDRRASESEHRAMAGTQTHMHTPMRPIPSQPRRPHRPAPNRSTIHPSPSQRTDLATFLDLSSACCGTLTLHSLSSLSFQRRPLTLHSFPLTLTRDELLLTYSKSNRHSSV